MKVKITKHQLPYEKKHLEIASEQLKWYFNYKILTLGPVTLKEFIEVINGIYGLHFKINTIDEKLFFTKPFKKPISLQTLIGKAKNDYTDMTEIIV